jgi:hypothetical protein
VHADTDTDDVVTSLAAMEAGHQLGGFLCILVLQ